MQFVDGEKGKKVLLTDMENIVCMCGPMGLMHLEVQSVIFFFFKKEEIKPTFFRIFL